MARGGHTPPKPGDRPVTPPPKPESVAKKPVTPAVTELVVNYSFGIKGQVVKFEESCDFHASETRKYNVEGMSEGDIAAFAAEVRADMHERLAGDLVPRFDKAQSKQEY